MCQMYPPWKLNSRPLKFFAILKKEKAFIYFDEKKMWRLAGFDFTCKTRSKRDGGTPKTR